MPWRNCALESTCPAISRQAIARNYFPLFFSRIPTLLPHVACRPLLPFLSPRCVVPAAGFIVLKIRRDVYDIVFCFVSIRRRRRRRPVRLLPRVWSAVTLGIPHRHNSWQKGSTYCQCDARARARAHTRTHTSSGERRRASRGGGNLDVARRIRDAVIISAGGVCRDFPAVSR